MNRIHGLNTYQVNTGWIMGFFAWCNLDLSLVVKTNVE